MLSSYISICVFSRIVWVCVFGCKCAHVTPASRTCKSVADAALLPSVTNMLKLLKQGAEKSCQPIRISVNARAWRTFEWNTRRCEQYKSATRASKNANEQAFSQITSSRLNLINNSHNHMYERTARERETEKERKYFSYDCLAGCVQHSYRSVSASVLRMPMRGKKATSIEIRQKTVIQIIRQHDMMRHYEHPTVSDIWYLIKW